MTILGAVLVGGASRRMGRDKATLPTPDGPLAERLARRLEAVPAVTEVVMVSRAGADPRFPERRVVRDRRPGRGPVAALEAALLAADGRPVLLLACDLPNVTTDLLAWVIGDGLATSAETPPSVRLPRADGRLQPLCALYSPACLRPVTDLLDRFDQEGGTRAPSLHTLLDHLEVTHLAVRPALPFHRPDLFHNLNTPQDLAGWDPR